MPRYLFSTDDAPPPSIDSAVELPDNAAALHEAAEVQEELARKEARLPAVNIWNEHGYRLGRIGTGSEYAPPEDMPREPSRAERDRHLH
jgi:hypothetical protein